MSFNQQPDLESGEGASVHYSDHPDFEKKSKAIDSSLQTLNSTLLPSLRKLLQQHEHARGDGTFSHQYAEITSKCAETFKALNGNAQSLNQYLRDCEAGHEDEDSLRYLRQKEAIQIGLVKNALQQFQGYQRKYTRLEKSLGKVPLAEDTSNPSVGDSLHQLQQQISISFEPIHAEELEEQALLVQEREREIQQISQDTQEINDIFLSLQDIVHEQQYQIDSIEDNIFNYSTDVQGASVELRRAEHYQKRSGSRMLCCLLILIGVFGSVVLIGLIF